ncbi:MAG: diaminopimelate epimerase [Bacteroidia bacterium]|jgi:diaminopimelate epimerase|nr:diaminopimelate epimerase [Bacteroidia bacterium]
MQIRFYKYQGTGNDFVLVDDRENRFPDQDKKLVERICDRHFGIGADGLMLLRNEPGYDFRMVYFNSDGAPGSMCGNGGRCICRFAHDLGIVNGSEINFIAYDGAHNAFITGDNVQLKMSDVHQTELTGTDYFIDTGSPHVVRFMSDVSGLNVYAAGREVRYSPRFAEQGTNVNFVEVMGQNIFVRTYERGVENETLSCGTGVTASALAASLQGIAPESGNIAVETKGGSLMVHYHRRNGGFDDIWLEGPAKFVFQGELNV